MLKVKDFVILKEQIGDIVVNSVGRVEEVSPICAKVLFLGKNKRLELPLSKVEFLDISKTGKPYPMKVCNMCYILKQDFIDFDVNQTDALGRKTTRPSCTECRKHIDGVSMSSAEKKRMEAIKPKDVFTCPICGKTSIPDITANLVIDHNHKTGKARAWICDSCNTGLGRFKDDISIMERAIEYLKYYNKLEENQKRGIF